MALANLFNEVWYLRNNPDVAAAVTAGLLDARAHFELYGRLEGRAPGPLFDPDHYLAQNPDVRAAVDNGLTTAYDHFLEIGLQQGGNFVRYFDANFYLQANPDIKAAVEAGLIRPADHFLMYGQAEGRSMSPFFDLGAYVRANPDLLIASEHEGFNALEHLLIYGLVEGRSLGNGINLEQFENDPRFKMAIADGGNPFDALARVAEIAPFLPSFEPPVGWQVPEDTPIPQDFVPVAGQWLILPQSVNVPAGMRLPDAFRLHEPTKPKPPYRPGDPVKPQEPGEDDDHTIPEPPVGPTPDPNPNPEPEPIPELPKDPVPDLPVEPSPDPTDEPSPEPPFTAEVNEGILSFKGTVEEDITVEVIEDVAIFTRGEHSEEIPAFSSIKAIKLERGQDLALTPEQIKDLPITTIGEGKVKVSFSSHKDEESPQDYYLVGNSKTDIENVALVLDNAFVAFPGALKLDEVESARVANILVNTADAHADPNRSLKSLYIEASGDSGLNLGNSKRGYAEIGYDLSDVTVVGGAEEDTLIISALYFSSESTKFDSSGYNGDMLLDTYMYGGNESEHDWSIQFGDGNDYLIVNPEATNNYPGALSSIDGGDGENILLLAPASSPNQESLYSQWADQDATWRSNAPTASPIITNFSGLVVEVEDHTAYQSLLFGNQFNHLMLDGEAEGVAVDAGFNMVSIYGGVELDATAIKGNDALIMVSGETDTTIKVGDIDNGRNSELYFDDGRTSDITISLYAPGLEGATVTIENMTISDTAVYSSDVIKNDKLVIAVPIKEGKEFDYVVKNFKVQKGDAQNNDADSDWYVDFVLEIDTDQRPHTLDDVMTLTLENVVEREAYNNLLRALDTVEQYKLNSTLDLIDSDIDLIEGSFYSEFAYEEDTEPTSHYWEGNDPVLIGLVGILLDEGTFEVEDLSP